MNEEIKQLIEEEALKYADSHTNGTDDIAKAFRGASRSAFKEGANLILSKWQEANRWRKVSEELPEYRDNDYQVLGLLKNGEYKTIWVIKDSIPQIEVFAYHGVIEWKPIE